MKGWFKFTLAVALVTLTVMAVGGCGGSSSPEATVKGAFVAVQEMDAEKLGSYFTEDIREEVVAGADLAFSLIDKIEISNLKVKTVSQTEDAATVETEYDYKVTLFGQSNTDHRSNILELVKVDGKWLITQPLEYGIGE